MTTARRGAPFSLERMAPPVDSLVPLLEMSIGTVASGPSAAPMRSKSSSVATLTRLAATRLDDTDDSSDNELVQAVRELMAETALARAHVDQAESVRDDPRHTEHLEPPLAEHDAESREVRAASPRRPPRAKKEANRPLGPLTALDPPSDHESASHASRNSPLKPLRSPSPPPATNRGETEAVTQQPLKPVDHKQAPRGGRRLRPVAS
jgi:hypothetical protein